MGGYQVLLSECLIIKSFLQKRKFTDCRRRHERPFESSLVHMKHHDNLSTIMLSLVESIAFSH